MTFIKRFFPERILILLFVFTFIFSIFSLNLYCREGKKLIFKEEISIKEGIYRPKDVKLDRDGNIFILDYGDQKIKKYTKEGKFSKSAGGKGEGPGETSRAFAISIDEENKVFVLEYHTGKVNVFDSDLNYLRTIRTGVYFSFNFIVWKGKMFIAGAKGLTPIEKRRKLIHIFDTQGRYHGSFAPQHSYKGNLKPFQIPPIYASPVSFWIENGKLFVGYSYLYEIRVYQLNDRMDLINSMTRKGIFKDLVINNILTPGGGSINIFILNGKIFHFYRVITKEKPEIYLDIWKESGEISQTKVLYQPEGIIPCFFDRYQNRFYFIQNEPEPQVVGASIKWAE